ncbi:MAG: arginase family protein [Verrucomicrobiota bacterium]|nr:arginase family protein [Verrucomicrobiota bacterium]MDQ6939786.1 arginase family protein [Verrucomicrobiota bacterium]
MNREDSNWPRAGQWLAGGAKKGGDGASLAVLGVPMNCSGNGSQCHLAPAAIREALAQYSLHDSDAGVDVGRLNVRDFGDATLVGNSAEGNFFRCVDVMRRAHVGDSTILLGGDNAITRPGLHSLGFPIERCGLLTFGAHNDLRELQHGLTNANPVRALLRDGVPGANIFQIGIQPFVNSAAYARVASEEGINVVTSDQVYALGIERVVRDALATLTRQVDAIYVNLDVDVLDRAFAPACPGARPGGLQPWMLRQAARLCGQHEKVLIMDIVEVDPTKDVADVTVLAAASFMLAFASGMANLAMK